ncbi:MAG TPA: diguanylate cyclase, partial [Thermoanaerobaculia bacterium]|nr:diguanylate cyclase [Thermoanaerobaculia bacterium]
MDPPLGPAGRELLASLLDLVATIEGDGTFAAVSGAVELLFGRDAAALRGRRVADLLDPEDQPAFEHLMARVSRGEDVPTRELRFHHAKGWEVWLEVALRTLPPSAELPRGGLMLGARDVTIRRRGEVALEESRERYRLLFERSPVGVMHYDAQLRVSDCNESFRKLIGASYEQLLGLEMRKLRDPRVLPALQAALEGGQGEYEGPYLATTSGARLWISMRTVPFHGPQGDVQGGICIVEDITDKQQAGEVQRATYEISEAVHKTDDLDELFRSIHGVLARLMPADNIYFALYDCATDTVSFPYYVDRYDPPPPSRRATSGLTEKVLHSGQPLLLATRGEVETLLADGKTPQRGTIPESWLGVPLRRGQESIGVMALQSYDPQVRFDERQREVLGFVAGQVTLAIERKQHQEQIERMAFFDGLTGLYNRRILQERAQQSLDLARRHGWSVAFLYLDLDRFKNVNDTLGHDAGDELLAEIAGLLRDWLRASDTLARLGGDEFAVLLLGPSDTAAGRQVAERLVAALDAPFELDGILLHVRASVGIACHPQHGDDPEELLRRADIALYCAKSSERPVEVYAAASDHYSVDRLMLAGQLRRGIRAGEIELEYQPKFPLSGGRPAGVEALARWQHPDLGRVGPDGFVPLAEQAGLMNELTDVVLRDAIAQCRRWRDEGLALR